LEAFYPELNPGAVIVADNMLGPLANVKPAGRRLCHAPGPPDRACPPAGSRIKTVASSRAEDSDIHWSTLWSIKSPGIAWS